MVRNIPMEQGLLYVALCYTSGRSFGAGEIPLLLLFFYLLNKVGLNFVQFLVLRSFAGRPGLKTLSSGEFSWGGTSTFL